MPGQKKYLHQLSPSLLFLLIVNLSCLLHSCQKKDNILQPGIAFGITGIEPGTAASGDTVSIFGAGFSADTAGNTITFGGKMAKVVSAGSQLLRVIVPEAGKHPAIQVTTGARSSTYQDPFTVALVIAGSQDKSLTWTPDNLYLLKGEVHVTKGNTLTIQAGTSILCDKNNVSSLIIDDGATLLINGTSDNPVVFASNQLPGLRYPGDWKGITLAATAGSPTDRISYLRIEYAGYHPANQPGAALQIVRAMPAGNLQYVEAAYSAGDGFRIVTSPGDGSVQYLKWLVAFGCAGHDYAFEGNSRVFGQFLLGLKDPVYADALGADGLLVQSARPVTISNLSLMGYSDLARNITGQNGYTTNGLYNTVVNANAGRGVHIGGVNYNGMQTTGTLQLFNSLVAAAYLAGISVDGPQSWAKYEDGTAEGSVVRHTDVTCFSRSGYTLYGPSLPLMGFVFSAENINGQSTGFQAVGMTAQQTAFSQYNDSALLMMVQIPYNSIPYYDELGIQYMALYKRLGAPLLIPQNGSPLLKGADFTDPRLSDAFFDGSGIFKGAFGGGDWTKDWANYAPQLTSYQ